MDRRVTLYYHRNGTVQEVSQQPDTAVFAVFVTLFCFLFGASYSFIVTSAVLSNQKLRRSTQKQLLALVSFTCFLDCLANESIAFESLVNNAVSWCSFSAAVFHFLLLGQAATVAFLCLERMATLHKRSVTTDIGILGLISTWGFGFVFSLPLFAASDVHFFPNRNACGLVHAKVWAPLFFLLGTVICWSAQAVSTVVTVLNIWKQVREQSFMLVPASSSHIRPSSFPEPLPNHRPCPVPYTILSLYVLLLLPQTASVVVSSFLDLPFTPDPWLDPRLPGDHIRTVVTNDLEPLLTYLRYTYNVAVPVAILALDPAVRTQSRVIFCCRRNVVSHDDSVFTTVKSMPDITQFRSSRARPISYRVPVLFTTSRGLHLRVAVPDPEGGVQLVTRFCDLRADSGPDRPSSSSSSRYGEEDDTCSPFAASTSNSDTRVILNPIVVKGQVHREQSPRPLVGDGNKTKTS